jgi:AcrR family transcriptional regulator
MPKIVDKEAKRLDIIHAALKEFARRGVANTKMADIATAAGIGKGTIYEYFKDKNEIFMASFNQFLEMMDTIWGKRLFRITDPVQKLKAFFLGWAEILTHTGNDYIEVMLEFWAEGIRKNHDFGKEPVNLKELYEQFRAMLKSILDDGIRSGQFRKMNTTYTASIMIGALDGLMLQWILDKSIFSVNEILEHLVDEFLKGIMND